MGATERAGSQVAGLQTRVEETDRLQQLLIDAEQRAASVPQLEYRIGELERALDEARRGADDARLQVAELDERLMRSEQVLVDVMHSPSWQVTKPLRRAKNLLR